MSDMGKENGEWMGTKRLAIGERELVISKKRNQRATEVHQMWGCIYSSYPIKKGIEHHHNHNRQISQNPPPPPYKTTYPHNKTAPRSHLQLCSSSKQ
jgi:hypothetical protein